MIDTIFPYLWAILLASFVGYIAWRNNFKVRRANACIAFRSAVLAELGSIYPNPANWPGDIDKFLRSKFAALQTSVENFRPFVPWWKRWLFDHAWRIYRLGEDGRDIDIQYYWQYRPHVVDGVENGRYHKYDNTLTFKENFKKNVASLLSFANET